MKSTTIYLKRNRQFHSECERKQDQCYNMVDSMVFLYEYEVACLNIGYFGRKLSFVAPYTSNVSS